MPREKFRTLTEQMFYVLLCLKEECCGMDILDRVPEMTAGRVTVGSGTLYNLLETVSGVWHDCGNPGRRPKAELSPDAEGAGDAGERIRADFGTGCRLPKRV